MSRLFGALSNLKSELVTPEVEDRPEIGPSEEATPAFRHVVKSDHHSLKVVHPPVVPLAVAQPETVDEVKASAVALPRPTGKVDVPGVYVNASPESRLVAWTEPNSLGAEKFRALVTRFDHLRGKRELKSFQVTSSVVNEGKTLVAGNVAVTLAKYSGSKTLLVEGDLHRPTLAALFGLNGLRGLSDWWSSQDQDLDKYVHRLNGLPLWFLPSGMAVDQPSDILRSTRLAKAFAQLASQFEWVVVDSTPMLPIVDVNLWSKLLDGTLLVVRVGVTPIKAIQRGLQALNHPKLIGVVVNEATESDQGSYAGQYYGGADRPDTSAKKR